MSTRRGNIRSSVSAIALLALLLLSIGAFAANSILRLATTTSTDNSGLIATLIPAFEKENGVAVHTVVVGTGRALNHARNGDVDVVLVHAKSSELELIEQGFTVNRQEFMYNEFIIVGPKEDPAGIHGTNSLSEAFKNIHASKSLFVSRGDDSGTHKKENELWQKAGVSPEGGWYRDVGQGMGRTLQIAHELGAYALTDKGTWLFLQDQLSLPVHVQGSLDGRNLYGIMAVNPEINEHVNADLANRFIEWITSEETKQLIADHRINGEQLFFPLN